MLTPHEVVKANYQFPDSIEDREYQIEALNNLAPVGRAGYFLDGGCGKTYITTCAILYKMVEDNLETTIAAMPPLLVEQWYKWLQVPKHKDGRPLKVLKYVGPPAKRKALNLEGYDFILMSINLFKSDFDELMKQLSGKELALIVDEGHSIKNTRTENYRTVKRLLDQEDAHLLTLTATPITIPLDGYAYIKLNTPTLYRNQTHFERVHVAGRDFFNKPTHWDNLDLLKENLALSSVTVKRREVSKDLPPVTFAPLHYDLVPEHQRLYNRLLEDEILKLPDGGKIDATQVNNMYNKSQQIVCNWQHFSGDDSKVAQIFAIAEEILSNTTGKLVVVANYRMTNQSIVEKLAKYNAVAIFGDVSPKQKQKNKDRFIEDPTCRVLAIQPSSGGFGVDGLQHVCSEMLFFEMPIIPKDFHQVVWRLDRDGQTEPVLVHIAVAQNTIQERLLENVLNKDELVGKVQRNVFNLRNELFGSDSSK